VRIGVLTVDDHPMLREGIASVINVEPNMEVVGEAQNGAEALDLFRQHRPDVTLMDLQMPVLDGIAATKAIRAEFPNARIIILTTYTGDAQVIQALNAGAVGYLLKSTMRNELINAIQAVHAGRRFIPAEIALEISAHLGDATLTERELRVLDLVAQGQSNKQIASQLHVAEETVKAYLRTIFSKLGVSDRTRAVTVALKRGLISL
jgi:DNA-binding NarL/FixJ family response regulator